MNVSADTVPGVSLPPPSSRPQPRRGNWRKSVFRLHGWMGLTTGLLLFVICFSGSVATLSNEIDWLLNPAIRAEVRDAPYDWSAMHETLEQTFPDGHNLGVYAPLAPGFAALSYVTVPNGQTRKVYLNPYTGELQGHTSFFNAQRFFRSFHRRFFDGTRGITIVTLMGFVLLAAAVTGFAFYKGWLKQLFTLRRRKGPRLLWSDLHKTTGIWGLAFSLLIALTGIFYFVEVCFQAADNYEALLPPPLPEVDETTLAAYGPQPELLPAGTYVEAAQKAFPGLEIKSMRMPLRPGDPVYVDGQAGNPITRDRANKVLLHPFTAEVIAIQRSSELSVVPFITDAVDPLHFGYFGGLATKVLWCILGLVLSFSILAGFYLWVVRSTPQGRKAAATRPASAGRLRAAAVSFAVTLAYFVVVVFATVRGIHGYGPDPASPVTVADGALGPYHLRVECAVPCLPTEGATYTVRFSGAGLPNYEHLTIGPADGPHVALEGPARGPSATLTAEPGTPLRFAATTRDGVTHTRTFQAPPATPLPPDATRPWPDTPPGVWWVIGIFVVLSAGAVGVWFYMLARVLRPVTGTLYGSYTRSPVRR